MLSPDLSKRMIQPPDGNIETAIERNDIPECTLLYKVLIRVITEAGYRLIL